MNKKQIIEGNLLIADYMGVDYSKYHQSWDWLIPVLQRIKLLRDKRIEEYYDEKIKDDFPLIIAEEIMTLENMSIMSPDITVCFESCVEIIKWYNTINKK